MEETAGALRSQQELPGAQGFSRNWQKLKLPMGPLVTTIPFEDGFGNILVTIFHFLKT